MAQYTYVLYNTGPSARLVISDSTRTVNIANKAFGGYYRWAVMVQLDDMPNFTNKRLVSMVLHAYFSDNDTGGAHTTYMGLITSNFTTATPFADLYAACTGIADAYLHSTNNNADFIDVANCDKVPISTNLSTSLTAFDIDLTNTEIAGMLLANPTVYKGFWCGLGHRGQHSANIMLNHEDTLYLTLVLEDAFSACTPPSAASLSAIVSEGNVTLSYSGAAGGVNNAMTGLEVQYAESDNNASWGAWTGYTTVTTGSGSGSFAVAPSSTRARYRKFRLRTLGAAGAGWQSAWVETGSVRRNSLPNAPSSLRFGIGGSGYFYSSLQCLWNNGGDLDGNFSGVYIRLARYNHDSGAGAVGWAWLDTDWVWLGNAASITYTRAQLAAKGAKAGDAVAFGLVAQDAMSAQNWDAAGMTASGYVYMAADPSAPTSFTASPSIQESGVTLAFSGANGNGIAIAGYDIEYKTSSTSGGVEGTDGFAAADGSPYSTSGTSGSKTDPANIARGYYEKWRIRTRNVDGAVSTWAYSNVIRKNSAPAAPDVTAPVNSKTIYNSQMRILASVGSDADGHSQTLSATGYTASSGGAQALGKKLVLRRSSAAAAGAQSVSASSTDTMGVAGGTVTRSFTYTVPAWTDPSLVAGETPVKAAHMMELRAAVDNVRAYYGMAAYPWTGVVTAGVTGVAGWTSHVAELRTAIEQVAAFVNGWDTLNSTNDISLPDWIAIPENRPAAAVIAQLRSVIPLL